MSERPAAVPHVITTQAGARFDCAPGDTILRAALRAGLEMPYSCNVGSCGNCRFELIEGEVAHLHPEPPAWTQKDLKRNRYLGCQAAPATDCTIKFRAVPGPVARARPRRRVGELIGIAPVTADITEFAISLDGDDGFEPGQYALLSVPGVEGGRAYSMCNLPGEGVWRFQIKRVREGRLTTHLFEEAGIGGAVEVDGPYGTAFLDTACPRDIVLIAGGSGLSPMVSVARGAAAAGMLEDRRLRFYYGGRDVADLFDPAMLGDVAGRMTFTAVLSHATSDWDGRHGFVHEAVARDMGEALKDHEIYFAGPAAMAGAVQQMAHGLGTPMDQLHFDEFY